MLILIPITMRNILITAILSLFLAAILIGSTINSSRFMLANAASSTSPSQQCEDAAKKISDKADAHQSNNVCEIGLARDSPTITLLGKKINEQVPNEFLYQPASASSNSQVLMLSEFTLLQSEADKVQQTLQEHHWTVTAIHNHQFFESPRLIYLHAQKQDNLGNILNEIRNALEQTSCGCV